MMGKGPEEGDFGCWIFSRIRGTRSRADRGRDSSRKAPTQVGVEPQTLLRSVSAGSLSFAGRPMRAGENVEKCESLFKFEA